jgi:bifunctional non-homologous end joining protein LigD
MTLARYKRKRDFHATPEPEGKVGFSRGGLRFVVQKHAASHVHYDFRLELDGVLKSWAIPKGPSMNPSDKRLAMMVEDHPLDYRTFEGSIPEGNYGAGEVIVWDEGTYHAEGTSGRLESMRTIQRGLDEGKMSFILQGKKLKGGYTLIRTGSQEKPSWLLIKKRDRYAELRDVREDITSVGSGKKLPGERPGREAKPATRRLSPPIASSEQVEQEHVSMPAQPVVHGLREDKGLRDVMRERPRGQGEDSRTPKNTEDAGEMSVGQRRVAFTHPDKLYWPEEEITKGDLLEYYRKCSRFILPYVLDRPQSLHRFPNGIQKDGFFQKDVGTKIPDWLVTNEIPLESEARKTRYLVCTDEASLVYMVNLGCIEVNPWFSRVGKLDNPDYLVLDLDPEGVKFDAVIETALVVKKTLDRAGAVSFCKTSGATGVHIVVPLKAKYDYEVAKNFAHLIARLVNAELPRLTSLERSPEKRRKKVYIDFLQNAKGQTVVAPYSVRPRPGAPVSTPLEWDELEAGLDPKVFTIRTILQRLKEKGDLFKKVLGQGIDIEAGLERLGEG